jgi:hypothetical protein
VFVEAQSKADATHQNIPPAAAKLSDEPKVDKVVTDGYGTMME